MSGKAARFSSATSATDNIAKMIQSTAQGTAPIISEIQVSKIFPDPKNNRRVQLDWDNPRNIPAGIESADELQEELQQLEELASSIAMSKVGLIHAITVIRRGENFHVVTGHRRVLAFKLLGRPTIPAVIRSEVLVRFAQFVENVQRRNIELDEALMGMQGLLEEMGIPVAAGMDAAPVVKKLISECSLRQRSAYRWANLLVAPEALHEAIRTRAVRTWSQVDQLVRLNEEELVDELALMQEEAGREEDELPSGTHQNQQPKLTSTVSRGSRRSKDFVTLGRVRNTTVIKTVIERVMGKAPDDVNWSDLKSVEKAFKKMIEELSESLQ